MGIMIEFDRTDRSHDFFRLLVYHKAIKNMKSEAVSLNKRLAEELLKVKESRRSMQMEKCFLNAISDLPDDVVIKDIDVLFNPAYKIDVLLMLIGAYKKKPFSLIWPGYYEDGHLVYSENGRPDYKVYDISKYDIVFSR